jgi:hypothetical protein
MDFVLFSDWYQEKRELYNAMVKHFIVRAIIVLFLAGVNFMFAFWSQCIPIAEVLFNFAVILTVDSILSVVCMFIMYYIGYTIIFVRLLCTIGIILSLFYAHILVTFYNALKVVGSIQLCVALLAVSFVVLICTAVKSFCDSGGEKVVKDSVAV